MLAPPEAIQAATTSIEATAADELLLEVALGAGCCTGGGWTEEDVACAGFRRSNVTVGFVTCTVEGVEAGGAVAVGAAVAFRSYSR